MSEIYQNRHSKGYAFSDVPRMAYRCIREDEIMSDTQKKEGINRRDFIIGASGAGIAAATLGSAFAQTNDSSSHFDVIIVGGGSAGAVIASRLSEDSSRRVLLLEAGKSYAPDSYPDVVRLQSIIGGDPEHDWGYTSEPGWAGASFPVPRGKVLGGSSAVNAGVAMRATASDFHRWTKAGLPNWSPTDVLPFYKKVSARYMVQMNFTAALVRGQSISCRMTKFQTCSVLL